MAITVTPPRAVARAQREGDDESLEEMAVHDFWNDPSHFLRRACQVADYGAPSGVPEPSERRHGPR
jgi:hypothetical protein